MRHSREKRKSKLTSISPKTNEKSYKKHFTKFKIGNNMNNNIDLVYAQYIKPLTYNERVFIVQRILQDFIIEQKKAFDSKIDKLKNLRKFKGIAKNNKQVINEEDWYKQ
jgi:hypothetical protein